MPRIARVVAPGLPHHIVQRGNRRQRTFFNEEDYRAYINIMSKLCARHGVAVLAYCLMPNHVHLIVVPDSEDGLRRAIGEAHRRYTYRINSREGWRGYLWQGRFSSFIMDEYYLLAAARYVELNPVRSGLVNKPQDWQWSSAGAHIKGRDDRLVKVSPLLRLVDNAWSDFLGTAIPADLGKKMRRHERTGRPLGGESLLIELESLLGRVLRPRKAGRKPAKK